MPNTANWTKGEIGLGGVAGGGKTHGYAPDGSLLCGAMGAGSSEQYAYPDRCNMDDPTDFDPAAPESCRRCVAAYNRLDD